MESMAKVLASLLRKDCEDSELEDVRHCREVVQEGTHQSNEPVFPVQLGHEVLDGVAEGAVTSCYDGV